MHFRACLFVLLATLSSVIARYNLDGLWYTQGTVTTHLPALTIAVFQDQGRRIWATDWNSTTKTCSYRMAVFEQLQSLESGPFATCFTLKPVLPDEGPAEEWAVFFPTKNLLMHYYCFAKVRYDGRCSEQPFVRIMTRTLDMSPKEKYIIDKRLRQFGESIHSVTFTNPRKNGCPRPMQKERRRKY